MSRRQKKIKLPQKLLEDFDKRSMKIYKVFEILLKKSFRSPLVTIKEVEEVYNLLKKFNKREPTVREIVNCLNQREIRKIASGH